MFCDVLDKDLRVDWFVGVLVHLIVRGHAAFLIDFGTTGRPNRGHSIRALAGGIIALRWAGA